MKFQKKKLKSGLTILFEKRDVPVTTVMLATRFGSAYESLEEKGIAHFIEHLCFKGTKKRTAKQIAFEVEKVGGVLNAFTADQVTAYHVKLPSEHLDKAVEVVFDIFFNPIFPKEEVEKERNVILEEIKMYRDSPKAHTAVKVKEVLYDGAFGVFGAGTEKSLKSIKREDLLKRHEDYYVPENSVLCVVGNNDFSEVVSMAERFCVDKKGKVLGKVSVKPRHLKLVEKRLDLHQANVVMGFHFPKLSGEGKYAADVFATMLGDGMSSKLFTEVREKRGLAYAVKATVDNEKDYGHLIIYIGTDKEKVSEVIKICLKEFAEMGNITEEELEDGKQQVIGNFVVGIEDSNETAMHLVFEEIAGDVNDHYDYAKNIKKVSLKDIKKLAAIKEYASFVLTPE